MKTYQITRLLVVAAVAFLPIACGTSPTGPDVATSSTSALRVQPLPPTDPGTSPDSVPLPVPSPVPTSPLPDKLDPSADVPSSRPAHRPTPVPAGDSGVDTTPSPGVPTSDPVDNGPVPTPEPATGDSGVIIPPTSDPADNGTVPTTAIQAPPLPPTAPPAPPLPGGECLAVTVQIANLSTFAAGNGVSLESILLDKNGIQIQDSSCEKVIWTADRPDAGPAQVVLTYGANSRFVTLSGPAGTYTIGAITPNGQSTELVVVLP